MSKAVKTLLVLFCVLSVTVSAVYFGAKNWLNKSGNITEQPDMDEVSVAGSGRRQDVFTLLVAATDIEGTRTDSIMVATFDMANKTVDVINVPRDTLIDTDRTADGKKINAAYNAGIEQLRSDVQSVLGFRPDKYMVLSFDGIAKMIDEIGGIDYEIPFKMSYHDASQGLSIEFKKGMQHLDGEKAVEFLRWRHNDDGSGYDNGDVGRVEKLQKFLRVLAKKVLTAQNVVKLPKLAGELCDSVYTDLTTPQILWLGTQCMDFDLDNSVSMITLAGDSAEIDINMGYYLWYYVVDEQEALEQINNGINPFEKDIEKLNIATPYTIYGAESPNWLDEMECRYAEEGRAFVPPEDTRYNDYYSDESYDDYDYDDYYDGDY